MHRTDVLYRPKCTFVHSDAHSLSHLPKFILSLSTCLCTHTHLLSTFEEYHEKYPEGAHDTIYKLTCAVTTGWNVNVMIDVYCKAPVWKVWKELADSALLIGNAVYFTNWTWTITVPYHLHLNDSSLHTSWCILYSTDKLGNCEILNVHWW